MRRSHTLPEDYSVAIEAELSKRGKSLRRSKALAQDVLRLSSYYTQNPDAESPWAETWAQSASLAYFFPLNYSRASAVAYEALRLGFLADLTNVVDFGSGMGSALLAFRDTITMPLLNYLALDISSEALELGQILARVRELGPIRTTLNTANPLSSHKALPASSINNNAFFNAANKTLVLASYALTELDAVPEWWYDAEALAIIEPSTHEDGRRLMKLRAELVARGYHIWAPCTHMGECPLLERSEKDWCHDRIRFEPPGPWWNSLEQELPMKNRTLTFSYLLARKSIAPPESQKNLSRVTGDRLEEKGKIRQSICRGGTREFLTWFPQRLKIKANQLNFNRGEVLLLNSDLEMKGAENSREIRVADLNDVKLVFPEV
jgi:hypothetical protein